MFNLYESKPVQRKALQIPLNNGNLMFKGGDNWNFECFTPGATPEHVNIDFKAHQTVERGDWIVYLNENDVYHCSDAVFRERNIVD